MKTTGTVTISLQELDSLRESLKKAREEAIMYKNQKEFRITFDWDIYDSKTNKRITDYRVMNYGNLELLKQADNWKEYNIFIRDAVKTIINESEILRFYNNCPKWVHKLFNR